MNQLMCVSAAGLMTLDHKYRIRSGGGSGSGSGSEREEGSSGTRASRHPTLAATRFQGFPFLFVVPELAIQCCWADTHNEIYVHGFSRTLLLESLCSTTSHLVDWTRISFRQASVSVRSDAKIYVSATLPSHDFDFNFNFKLRLKLHV
jgi:hypothetical protein